VTPTARGTGADGPDEDGPDEDAIDDGAPLSGASDRVDASGGQGVQVGDRNVQVNVFHTSPQAGAGRSSARGSAEAVAGVPESYR
jgi:hypothetical protein